MRLLRQYLSRYTGAHRTALSGKARVAVVMMAGVLAVGSGAVAVGTANAGLGSGVVTLIGRVTCPPSAPVVDTPTRLDLTAPGDGGTATLTGRSTSATKSYSRVFREVPKRPGSETVTVTVTCSISGKHTQRKTFGLNRPLKGSTQTRNITVNWLSW